jgi:hypothetical protein
MSGDSVPWEGGAGIKDVWNPQGQTGQAQSVPDERRGSLTCRHCSKPVKLLQASDGAWGQVNLDYTQHTCQGKRRSRLCKRCELPIRFKANDAGRWVPCDVSGGAHVCRRRR